MFRRSTGAMPPVMGSESLKATKNGFSHRVSFSQAARFASVAGSSAAVGTSVGIARGPALCSSVGNGAS